jgi:hypothetical protein
MAIGKKTGGRTKGTKNKATISKLEAAQMERERLAEIERLTSTGTKEAAAAVATAGMKRGKDVLAELMGKYMQLAALYQPWPNWNVRVDESGNAIKDKNGKPVIVNANPNYDEARFDKYSGMAKEAAGLVAPFHDPRYSAMMVGATVVTKIEVVGGLPDDFRPPAGPIDLKPGIVLTPDDIIDVPLTSAKAVNE